MVRWLGYLVGAGIMLTFSKLSGQISLEKVHFDLISSSPVPQELRFLGTNKMGSLHVYYFNQQWQDIDIYNHITMAVVDNHGLVRYSWSNNTTLLTTATYKQPTITLMQAVSTAIDNKISSRQKVRLVKTTGPRTYFSHTMEEDISAQLYWRELRGVFRLAYGIDDQTKPGMYWRTWVDASTGEVITKESLAKSCFSGDFNEKAADEGLNTKPNHDKKFGSNFEGNESYFVFPFPADNALSIAQTVVSSPADPVASPFGWHDINGQIGPEFTITKGNNATVFIDRNADFVKDEPEPEGGVTLQFNQPIDLSTEPEGYKKGSTIQLFYQLNTLHDVLFHHGFDENSNFQQFNYQGIGLGGDPVIGLVQYGADKNERDNADFIPSTDGKTAYLRPYVWSRSNSQLLTITSPSTLSGMVESRGASFGPAITTTPIIGKVIPYADASFRPNLGCQTAINSAELKGNIALIDRGICFFQEKILNAQKAGAIACIICNYENALVSMGDVEGLDEPIIPAIAIKYNNCQAIKSALSGGVTVRLQLPSNAGTNNLDATMDNGVIAHEYYHGVSERLVGGPQTIGCLNNIHYDTDRVADDGEQMGEGWSDFFALYMTTSPKDLGQDSRGIATYLLREGPQGKGIRSFPYSTDIEQSPYKYEDIWTATIPHGVGAVWNAILWDIYWEMVDLYGFDANLINGMGGNNRALTLITEALKITPCNPGFIDGRDALLTTDKLLNGSAHECLLWKIFAKRGIGYESTQGNPSLIADGTTSFENHPKCLRQVTLKKTLTPTVQPGENIEVRLEVKNHLDKNIENLLVEDKIPSGSIFNPNSSNVSFQISTNNLSYLHRNLAPGDSLVVTYTLRTNPMNSSAIQFFDNMEHGDANWDYQNLDGIDIWSLESTAAYSGKFAWFVANKEAYNDQVLQNFTAWKVQGNFPVLKFYHRIASQWGIDGGVIEISADQGATWKDAHHLLFRQGYQGPISPATFLESGRRAFYGEMEEYEPIYVDLRPYKNQSIKVRWRFASNNTIKYEGWYIDDVQIMDALAINSEACISGTGVELVCATASGEGTIIEGDQVTAIHKQIKNSFIKIKPNPAQDIASLTLSKDGLYEVAVSNLFGEKILEQKWINTGQDFLLHTKMWTPGMYIVTIKNKDGYLSEKFIKQ